MGNAGDITGLARDNLDAHEKSLLVASTISGGRTCA
jgi:hypothetical protein